MTFQLIRENDVPKSLEDYADELWAEQSLEQYKKRKKEKTYSLESVKKMLDPEILS